MLRTGPLPELKPLTSEGLLYTVSNKEKKNGDRWMAPKMAKQELVTPKLYVSYH